MFCSGFHSALVSTLAMNQGCVGLHKMSIAPGVQPALSLVSLSLHPSPSLSLADWHGYLTLIAKFESASAPLSLSVSEV